MNISIVKEKSNLKFDSLNKIIKNKLCIDLITAITINYFINLIYNV